MVGRKKLNKTRIQIKIDTELKFILDKKRCEKSSLINSLLWKYLGLESPNSIPKTLFPFNSPSQIRTGVCGSRAKRELGLENSDESKIIKSDLFR
ncbi:MAG: hypothetical protein PHT94_04985, partial [Candidatus Nanoarchaeia archaeon]|nr:hypothetical protein [Candidatus Nanoarchaeia archaeon]